MKPYSHSTRTRILMGIFAVLLLWGPSFSGAEESQATTGRFFMGALYGTQDTEMRTRFVRHVYGDLEEESFCGVCSVGQRIPCIRPSAEP